MLRFALLVNAGTCGFAVTLRRWPSIMARLGLVGEPNIKNAGVS